MTGTDAQSGAVIRPATTDDAPAIAAIYAPFVRDTAISFEDTPPDAAEIARRIETTRAAYPYLVTEIAGAVCAYAYAGPYRARHAYRHSAEVTAYAAPEGRGQGLATAMYADMLDTLRATGFHTAIAIITLPNAASVKFHQRNRFRHIGTVAEVGRKFGKWHDTGIWQRHLGP